MSLNANFKGGANVRRRGVGVKSYTQVEQLSHVAPGVTQTRSGE